MTTSKRILYLQTEDWAFLLHRLPMARAARDAGFEVHVATRIGERRGDIEAEGFIVHPVGWQRGSRALAGALKAIGEIRSVIKSVRPDVLHNVAIKPTLLGSIASVGIKQMAVVNNISGLGSAFLATSTLKRLFAGGIGQAIRVLMNRRHARAIVQNPDDHEFLRGLGVKDDHIVRIAGSGVDTVRLQPLPVPDGSMTLAYVGRMLEDKGLRALVEAHHLLAEAGAPPTLLLAGTPDPENPTTISEAELNRWNARDGIEWLGHVSDIEGLWRRAHVAVLPSRREGLPKSLLEAAALGRPMIASDAPGCREIAIAGRTALTHPVDDAAAIAEAIKTLSGDGAMRTRFADAARRLVEERFSDSIIGSQTVALYETMIAVVAEQK